MKKLIVLFFGLFLAVGCVPQEAIDWSAVDAANVTKINEVSENLQMSWPIYAGALEVYDDHIGLPKPIMLIKSELDALYDTENPCHGKCASKALILRGLLVKEVGQHAIKDVLPGFLEILEPLL